MTSDEFISWLEGFLEGKGSISPESITTLKDKLSKVQKASSAPPVPIPYYPVYPLKEREEPYNPNLPHWVGPFSAGDPDLNRPTSTCETETTIK